MKQRAVCAAMAAACLMLNGFVLNIREYKMKDEKRVEQHTICFFLIPIYHSSDSREHDRMEEGGIEVEIEEMAMK